MKYLNEDMIKNLSFPDFSVKKMEFSPREKILNIFVDGAWLEVDGGTKLGKGTIFFEEWESLSVYRFNPDTEKWSHLDESSAETLRDLCEIKFFNSTISLCGFGKQTGQWIEWRIVNAKKHAEFD